MEVHAVANRVRSEFLEMPEVLVQSAFLRRTPGGMVTRIDT
jgi:hypothetical protein